MRSRSLFGNAWQFDGVNDYVSVPDDPTLNFGAGDFSVNLWVKLDDSYRLTLGWLDKRIGNTGWIIYRTFNDRIEFAIGDGTTFYFVRTSGAPIIWNLGQWYMITCVLEGTDRTNWKIYIDGALRGQGSGTDAGNSKDSTRAIDLGRMYNRDYMNGAMDEITIYNRALTPAEVAYLYNNGNGNAPSAAMLPNLVARWTFDTATGTLPNPILADVSGNGNNGTGQNFAVNPLTPH